MSCQIRWNFKEYKKIQIQSEDLIYGVLTAPAILSRVQNNTLDSLNGLLEVDVSKTINETEDTFSENYDIVFGSGTDIVGSVYVNTAYKQPKNPDSSEPVQTILNNVSGTVVGRKLFAEFDNGTAIIEYDNVTGERCLTLLSKE